MWAFRTHLGIRGHVLRARVLAIGKRARLAHRHKESPLRPSPLLRHIHDPQVSKPHLAALQSPRLARMVHGSRVSVRVLRVLASLCSPTHPSPTPSPLLHHLSSSSAHDPPMSLHDFYSACFQVCREWAQTGCAAPLEELFACFPTITGPDELPVAPEFDATVIQIVFTEQTDLSDEHKLRQFREEVGAVVLWTVSCWTRN